MLDLVLVPVWQLRQFLTEDIKIQLKRVFDEENPSTVHCSNPDNGVLELIQEIVSSVKPDVNVKAFDEKNILFARSPRIVMWDGRCGKGRKTISQLASANIKHHVVLTFRMCPE